jgi:hypothetical protein
MLITAIHHSLDELIGLLSQLSDREYANPCCELSNATIGEHTRHIIEMFQCLEQNYESGLVNYDNRARDIVIQTNTEFACRKMAEIKNSLGRPDKTIRLQQVIDGQAINIESNYARELLYNLEHCIHHQALIKVALLQCTQVKVDDNFGVARSTIEYRNQCVQ